MSKGKLEIILNWWRWEYIKIQRNTAKALLRRKLRALNTENWIEKGTQISDLSFPLKKLDQKEEIISKI